MRFPSSLLLALAIRPFTLAQSPLPTTSGTGFAGAPYSATETTIKTAATPDGAINPATYVTLLWRDAEGRTRQELIRQTASGVEYHSIIITDPIAGLYRKWTEGGDSISNTTSLWPLDPQQRIAARISNLPPLRSSPGITSCGAGCTREDLDPQTINGVSALGSRTRRIVRVPAVPTPEDLPVINELWTSPELRIIVRHVMDDPRTGTTTTNVTNIVRGDPNPALFRIPDGYAIRDMTAR